MAQWQIFKGHTPSGAPIQIGELFDDGEIEGAGDDGFDTEARDAEVKRRGGDGWSYVGRSTQVSEKMETVLDADVAALVDDPNNGVDDEAAARRLVLGARGLNEQRV